MKITINSNSNDLKQLNNSNTHSHISNIQEVQATDTLIQLRSGMRLVTFCCFLTTFILSIILSSVYFMIQINGALKVFNDIEDNWNNNFILDITEKSTSAECSQSPLISYNFPGATKGCFCEDCKESSHDDKYEFEIKALLDNAYNDKDGSIDEAYILDDRILENTDDSYEDYDSDDFDEILNYKIISKDCDSVKSINKQEFFQTIAEVPSKTIQSLLADDNNSEINLCIQRSQTHNFLNSYFLEDQTECEDNQILCKGTDDSDKSYWFCGDASEKCPIRKLSIIASNEVATTTETYEEELKLSNGYSVLISRFIPNIMPISEFGLFEGDGPCIDAKKVWGLFSKTLIVNPLLNMKQSKICKRDTRYKKSDLQIPQKQFFKHFGVLHTMRAANYPLFFLPQEAVELDLFSRSYISFSITCRDILDDVIDLGITIEKLKRIAISLIAFSSSLSIVLLIDAGYILSCLYKINKKKPGDVEVIFYPWKFSSHLILSIIYSCLKYPIALALCILDCIFFYKLINTREIGEEILIRNCTDKISSDQFHVLRSHLSFYGIFFHLIVCLGYWSSDIHLINFWRQYCFMKKTKMTPFDEFFALAFVDEEDEDDEIQGEITGKKQQQQKEQGSSAGDSIQQDHNQGELKQYLKNDELQKGDESKVQQILFQKSVAKEMTKEESLLKQLSLQQPPLILNYQNSKGKSQILSENMQINTRKISQNIQGNNNSNNPINNTNLILKEENQEDEDEIITDSIHKKKSVEIQAIPEIIEQQQLINITSASEIPHKQEEDNLTWRISQQNHLDSPDIDTPKLKKASVSVPLYKQEQFKIQIDSPLSIKHYRRHSTPMEQLLESPEKLPIIIQDFEEDQQQTSNSFIKSSKKSTDYKDSIFPIGEKEQNNTISQNIDIQKDNHKSDDNQLESLRKLSGENTVISQNIFFNTEKSSLNSYYQKQNSNKSQFNQVIRAQSSRDSSRTDYQPPLEINNIQGEQYLVRQGIQKNKQLELINFEVEEESTDQNQQDNKIEESSSL